MKARVFFTDSPTGLVDVKCPSAQLLRCCDRKWPQGSSFLHALVFLVVVFIFIIYCGSVDFQCWLCFRRLGATSDLHGRASLLALGSVSRVGYYSELDTIPCAAQQALIT